MPGKFLVVAVSLAALSPAQGATFAERWPTPGCEFPLTRLTPPVNWAVCQTDLEEPNHRRKNQWNRHRHCESFRRCRNG
jgi:hypothetical protein